LSKYLVHKAVEFSALSAARKKAIGAASISDLASKYDLQYKYDGCNVIVKLLNQQSFQILSRTGEIVRSMDHIGHRLLALFRTPLEKGQTFAVLGEAWAQKNSQARISGWFRKHDPVTQLQFAAFDALPLEDFEVGVSAIAFEDRYAKLAHFTRGYTESDKVFLCPLLTPGTYGDPMEVAESLRSHGDVRAFDGAVLRDPLAGWKAGSGLDGAIIKVKPRPTFDLRIVGVEEGEGKYKGTTGKVVFQFKDGTVVKAAGGDNAQRAEWFKNPASIVGQIGEVAALERLPSGELREPVFKNIRFDKVDID
jgi:DNA ligase-1